MKQLVLLTIVFTLSACATVNKFHPKAVREEEAVLQKGWSFVEKSGEAELDTGVQPLTYGSPVLEGDRLVFGSERFGLMVIHKENGLVLWQKKIHDGVSSQPLILQNKVYVGSDDGGFHAIDLQTGAELWQANFALSVQGAPILAGDRLIVGTIDESVHALDPSTGKILWTYKRPLVVGNSIKGGGNPAYINGNIWVGFSDGALVVLDTNDGSLKQERQFHDNPKFMNINAKPIAWHEGVLVPTYDGKLRYLKKDFNLIWEFPAGASRSVLTSTLQGDLIFLPSTEGNVYAIHANTGKEAWHFTMNYGTPTSLALVQGSSEDKTTLIIASSEHKVYAVDALTGKELGKISLGRGSGSFSSIAVDQKLKNVYVLSHFSRIHQFKVRR